MSTAASTSRSSAPRVTVAPSSSGARRIFFLLFLSLAVLITWANRENFFGTAFYEEGDDAANALQIHRAKRFQELHGNYSRFGWHHPGPAFFYAYAAGEWLLHDLTRLAPAPRNAHLYTGALLQLAFYALAIALLARHARQPLLLAAVALLAGALHFAHIDRVLFSIWPPDVLLMPFLCFVVACAAVARGDRMALPFFVLAGSFLVHGHIAQPLFVGPMAALALWLAWRGPWRGHVREVARTSPALAAAALLGLFLLPLVIDLFAGRDSNAAHVLLHLRFQTDDGQNLWQALLLYASAFVTLNDPTMFNTVTGESYAPFVRRWWLLLAWGALLAGAAWRFFRRPAADDPVNARAAAFGRRLLLFWLIASALTVVWAMRQDGGFTNYNSHFNHTLVHVVAFAGIFALVGFAPRTSRPVVWAGTFAAVVAFAAAVPFEFTPGSRGDELEARVHGLLLADPNPSAPKLITMAEDDERVAYWYEAATLARAFQRRGIEFRVHPTWRFMFGDDKVFTGSGEDLVRGAYSVWHVVPRRPPAAGVHVLNRECSVIFPAEARLERFPIKLNFSLEQNRSIPTVGISGAEDGWTWTEGKVAGILFHGPEASADITLTLEAAAYMPKETTRPQRAILSINGTTIGSESFAGEDRTVTFPIPREVWNRQQPRVIHFDLPDALSPAAIGSSGDQRELGLRLRRVAIAPRG